MISCTKKGETSALYLVVFEMLQLELLWLRHYWPESQQIIIFGVSSCKHGQRSCKHIHNITYALFRLTSTFVEGTRDRPQPDKVLWADYGETDGDITKKPGYCKM